MKKNNKNSQNKALSVFATHKVLTVLEIKTLVGKSLRTTYTRLKEWNALRSYNKNGQYYTLPTIAAFNEHGIWSYQEIHFSRYGNLKETFFYLIKNSSYALNSKEIGEILQMNPHSFLSQFINIQGIKRQKFNGRYLWYATEEQFQAVARRNKAVYYAINDAVGIQILILHIKFPELDDQGLVKLLEKQGIFVGIEQVGNFFSKHGIEKKRAL